jgi:putative zinc finger/helix-turn-helix YgiT family protein
MNSIMAADVCRACKIGLTHDVLELETFPYGDDSVEISVTVPVIRCNLCDFVYTDKRAEKARHDAVCDHFRLLTPEQIQHIRKSVLGMSRANFHAAFGLSSASVERWENGKLLQSEAADTLIRALEDPSIAQRFDRRNSRAVQQPEKGEGENVIWGRFPSLGSNPSRDDARSRSKTFNLRLQAL